VTAMVGEGFTRARVSDRKAIGAPCGSGSWTPPVIGLQASGIKQDGAMTETPEARVKRMTMRSWRRGTKEMDLILGPYADTHLAQMANDRLAIYDVLLEENDQDLLPMVLGQRPAPTPLADLVAEIGVFARNRLLKP